ncbi:MAG: rhamnulokinase [Lachnospiraceae bacterium]
MRYFLAVDIGAESGRHILGWMENGLLRTEEIYRFSNGIKKKDEHLIWEIDRLFSEVLEGMRRCGESGRIPESVGIDTWAVDFVLLDKEGRRIGDAVSYRDGRTQGADELVYGKISEEALYYRTGIQKQIFNTIYQLAAVKEKEPERLEKAERLLMIPDYLHYLLTGTACQEYTNATTTQLINPATKEWDTELLALLGFPEKLFATVKLPGSTVGTLLPEIAEKVGYQTKVVLPATHDTGAAVMAVPESGENVLYISSGTWSLLGTEQQKADCSEESRRRNFTNEGGYAYRYRYLKNIMGLWMIQNVKKELDAGKLGAEFRGMSYAELCGFAEEAEISSLLDCNAPEFLAPESMTDAVCTACKKSGLPVPKTPGEFARVIYRSLAKCYGETVRELEQQTGKTFSRLHIIGGGSNAEYLNRLTAEATGKTVLAGPAEATAVGNLLAQLLAAGEFASLKEARKCVEKSFPLKEYRANREESDTGDYEAKSEKQEEAYDNFRTI